MWLPHSHPKKRWLSGLRKLGARLLGLHVDRLDQPRPSEPQQVAAVPGQDAGVRDQHKGDAVLTLGAGG